MKEHEKGRPQGQLTTQPGIFEQEQEESRQESQSGKQLTPLLEQDAFRKLSFTPQGQDPAFWPIKVLNEVSYFISVKDQFPPGSYTRTIGEKYAPLKETLRNVRIAYSILAYPHCHYQGWREEIGKELELNRQSYGRDQVELNDSERQILSQLTGARNLPFDPERRVYSYSEVPVPPWVDPFGRRHMTTEQIRQLCEEED